MRILPYFADIWKDVFANDIFKSNARHSHLYTSINGFKFQTLTFDMTDTDRIRMTLNDIL